MIELTLTFKFLFCFDFLHLGCSFPFDGVQMFFVLISFEVEAKQTNIGFSLFLFQ